MSSSVQAFREIVTQVAPYIYANATQVAPFIYTNHAIFKRNVVRCNRLFEMIEPIMEKIILGKQEKALLAWLLTTKKSLSDENTITDATYLASKKKVGNFYVKCILMLATNNYRKFIHGRTPEGILQRIKKKTISTATFLTWAQYWIEDMHFALTVASKKILLTQGGFEESFHQKLDRNHNGEISENEFIEYLHIHRAKNTK